MTPTNDVDDTMETDLRQAISATDLRFAYHKGTTAVRTMALGIRKGELFEHVAPNGAGGNRADQEARDATNNETTRRVRGNQ